MYIKGHKYCIEERAKKVFGTTEIYIFGGYLLENGEMLNFTYSGYQRDEDHRIIGQFFSKAQGTDALIKMMKRGNIRMMCFKDMYGFELCKKPTKDQLYIIKDAEKEARQLGYRFYIDVSKGKYLNVERSYDSLIDFIYEDPLMKGENYVYSI